MYNTLLDGDIGHIKLNKNGKIKYCNFLVSFQIITTLVLVNNFCSVKCRIHNTIEIYHSKSKKIDMCLV